VTDWGRRKSTVVHVVGAQCGVKGQDVYLEARR